MKRITECFSANPGNGLNCLGVTNRYTPIDNIITNVRNYFGSLLGLVIQKAEDGISLKITSSSFANPRVTRDIMYNSSFDGYTRLYDYIRSQGLDMMKIIEVGGYCIVYCSPGNVVTKDITVPVEDLKKVKVQECEMYSVVPNVSEEFEQELEDTTKKDLAEIFDMPNKIEAATKFEEIISKKLPLPENVYIKATKDIDGHESIALRYRYEKDRPFGGKIQQAVSLINIYSTGANAVWAGIFDEFEHKFDDDIENYVEELLKFIGATETQDKKVWNIDVDGNLPKEETNDEEDDDDKDEDVKDNNDNKDVDEDENDKD